MDIRFQGDYLKLHKQTEAVLLDVKVIHFSHEKHSELEAYDTLREDGTRFPLEDKPYILLVFLGNKEIPFTTLRTLKNRDGISSFTTYYNSIGKTFEVQILGERHGL